jgi:hypothetical protein
MKIKKYSFLEQWRREVEISGDSDYGGYEGMEES